MEACNETLSIDSATAVCCCFSLRGFGLVMVVCVATIPIDSATAVCCRFSLHGFGLVIKMYIATKLLANWATVGGLAMLSLHGMVWFGKSRFGLARMGLVWVEINRLYGSGVSTIFFAWLRFVNAGFVSRRKYQLMYFPNYRAMY
jgi:hypothetical protein